MKQLIPIIEDTREQLAWRFDPDVFSVESGTMKTGDYTIKGYEDRICVERKSLGDFVGSVIQNWLHHRKRWYRMASFDIAAVVVEANIEDVWAHRYESEANPASVLGKAHAIFLDHNLPVLWWGSKSSCVPMAEAFFRQAWAKLRGGL